MAARTAIPGSSAAVAPVAGESGGPSLEGRGHWKGPRSGANGRFVAQACGVNSTISTRSEGPEGASLPGTSGAWVPNPTAATVRAA